jgi:hypothetical protein
MFPEIDIFFYGQMDVNVVPTRLHEERRLSSINSDGRLAIQVQ